MKILVKSIQGRECTVEIDPDSTILDLKREIEKKLQIPIYQQTIVLTGTVLQDERPIKTYPKLTDGTKLFIAVKKSETLGTLLTKFFLQYYSPTQTAKIVGEFMKDFQNKIDNLSLDDLERIAKADMENRS